MYNPHCVIVIVYNLYYIKTYMNKIISATLPINELTLCWNITHNYILGKLNI